MTKYSFKSSVLGDLSANLNLYLPPSASASKKVPILYFLAGLTCTEDNAAQKGGMYEAASQEGIALCFPDTSPRGAKIEGEDESYDFGSGAGFYINATKDPWSKHYKVRSQALSDCPSTSLFVPLTPRSNVCTDVRPYRKGDSRTAQSS